MTRTINVSRAVVGWVWVFMYALVVAYLIHWAWVVRGEGRVEKVLKGTPSHFIRRAGFPWIITPEFPDNDPCGQYVGTYVGHHSVEEDCRERVATSNMTQRRDVKLARVAGIEVKDRNELMADCYRGLADFYSANGEFPAFALESKVHLEKGVNGFNYGGEWTRLYGTCEDLPTKSESCGANTPGCWLIYYEEEPKK
jgi:hypothetical protein